MYHWGGERTGQLRLFLKPSRPLWLLRVKLTKCDGLLLRGFQRDEPLYWCGSTYRDVFFASFVSNLNEQ